MVYIPEPFRALEERHARQGQIAENSIRLGWCHFKATSTGWGEFKIPECFEFDMTFIEEPNVTHGMSTNGDLLVDTRFPRAHGGVYRWKRNAKGFYQGAWLFVVVDTRSPYITTTLDDPGYSIDHYFTFAGTAIKDLPDHLLVE